MPMATDQYRLEDIARDHRIDAGVFVPFAIVRLRSDQDSTEATIEALLRDVVDSGDHQRIVRLAWSAESGPVHPLAVQERTVTEWAACGVACAVAFLYARLRVFSVAAGGDRFDYWVSDGERDYALEMSGTMASDVEDRHRIKVRQLREYHHGVDGYVIVVGFVSRSVIFSFNRFEEEVR